MASTMSDRLTSSAKVVQNETLPPLPEALVLRAAGRGPFDQVWLMGHLRGSGPTQGTRKGVDGTSDCGQIAWIDGGCFI
jgi:hypothetical protein